MELGLGVLVFTAVVIGLVFVILGARTLLVESGDVAIRVNDNLTVIGHLGDKLINALSRAQLFVPSACGGRGTCGLCRVRILEGGGAALPTETALLTKRELARHERLSCQVTVKHELSIVLPDDVFGVRKWACTVRSNRNVSTFIKELVLDLDAGEIMEFRAGGYVQVERGPSEVPFAQFDIDPPFDREWERLRLRRLISRVRKPVTRAYSMANYPDEKGVIMLNVRIALPPPGAYPGVPPGEMSSYLFSLRPGDRLNVFGPFGQFYAKETEAEMVFIGGGAGMAPMRSHILDQLWRLKSKRKISFWYGARSLRELFYVDLFNNLESEYENFTWHVALSEPLPEDHWKGHEGFIHQVVYDHYLKDHAAPEDCEYYICGPPLMNSAVLHMLDDLGVPDENIRFDDFGI